MIGQARNLSKSDTPNDKFNWCLVTDSAGSLVIGSSGGNDVTLSNVPVGVWIPVGNATHILTTSTAIGLMVA